MGTHMEERRTGLARRYLANLGTDLRRVLLWPWKRRSDNTRRPRNLQRGADMQATSIRWATFGGVVLAAALYACGATGTTETTGEINVPFVHVGWNSNSEHFDVTSNQPNVCVTLTWFDSRGASIGEFNLRTDGNGSASGDVPPGAARWELTVVECPEENLIAPPYAAIPLRDFFIFGAPLVPSDDPAADNLMYSLRVHARSLAEAEALTEPILQGGIGTPIPKAVVVLSFATLTADPYGARLVQAQPGIFEEWSLDFNNGAFTADLSSSTHYPVNGWDVVETVIPLSAFDYGIVPGVTYSNEGATTYKTDRMDEAGSTLYRYAFEN